MKIFGNETRRAALLIAAGLATALSAFAFVDDEETATADRQVQERTDLRKAYGATQKVETQNEVTTTVTTQPVVADADAPVMSRSELLRRKRIREEMKNEDLLSQRLEELRLREEEKRTKKILKTSGLDEEEAEQATAKEMSPAPVITETVKAPITEKAPEAAPVVASASMQMTPAPQVQQTQMQPIVVDRMGYSQSAPAGATISAMETSVPATTDEGRISISPKIGFASIQNDAYEFNSKYAAGLGLAFGVSDYLAVELGYLYSQNSIRMTTPGYAGYGYGYNNPYGELNYNQNLFDLSLKLHFVGYESKVRPWVGGGGGYSMGYINYDQRTQQAIRMYNPYASTEDYELNQIVGNVGAGIDFKVGKNAAIGVGYKLLVPVSSSENEQLYNYAFYNVDPTKDAVRGTLKDSRMQVFTVNGTFSF